ncbi:MAG: rRNA maturation RNase YbeY [Caldithrix sp.]|nr:rRNA maturation RNase YbeY [Caldithrix sp.]
MDIQIHQLDAQYPIRDQLQTLVRAVAEDIHLQARSCDVIFVDDHTLKQMHETYLQDATFTDVMTFDLGDTEVEGEIYISLDRARENARTYQAGITKEIMRLVIHGLLHLKGYKDKSPTDRQQMKQEEDLLIDKFVSQ